MPTFGPLLRRTREQRGVSLDAIARETRLSKRYLVALEEETIGKLPGGNYNRAYLRTYARFLKLEPESLLRDYAETEARLTENAEAEQLAAMNRALERRGGLATDSSSREGRAWRDGLMSPLAIVVVAIGGLSAVGGAVWVAVSGLQRASAAVEVIAAPTSAPPPPATSRPAPSPPPASSTSVRVPAAGGNRLSRPAGSAAAPASVAAGDPAPTADVPPAAAVTAGAEPETVADDSGAAGRLTVAGSGVGTGVVDRQLVGQGERFSPGSTVVFWTHVRGGRSGDTIDHVWFHDGTLIGAASLSVGSPDWRTQSRRVLDPGGVWTVEARDPEGHVLARHEIRTSDE